MRVVDGKATVKDVEKRAVETAVILQEAIKTHKENLDWIMGHSCLKTISDIKVI